MYLVKETFASIRNGISNGFLSTLSRSSKLFSKTVPRPLEYGIARNEMVQKSILSLVEIDTDRTETPLPSFGFVFDF